MENLWDISCFAVLGKFSVKVLKLAPSKPLNTVTVTKEGKTGNLFAQSVCWEQMTRKIKSAYKVETSTKGCYFALCVFFLSFLLFHKDQYILENLVRDTYFKCSEKTTYSFLHYWKVLTFLCSFSHTGCETVLIFKPTPLGLMLYLMSTVSVWAGLKVRPGGLPFSQLHFGTADRFYFSLDSLVLSVCYIFPTFSLSLSLFLSFPPAVWVHSNEWYGMIAWLRVPVSALQGRVSTETTAITQLPVQAKGVTGVL